MSLLFMIIAQVVLWIAGFFVKGFSLYQVCLIVPVVLFAIRKFGIKIGCSHIIVCEVLFLFFSTIFTMLFSEIDTVRYVLSLVLRIISILIAVIDDTMYIYVTEERKVK